MNSADIAEDSPPKMATAEPPENPAPTPTPTPMPTPTSPVMADLLKSFESKTLEDVSPLVDYAVQQALEYKEMIQKAFDSTIEDSKSRLSEIRSTSSAHFQQTLESLKDVKSELAVYEDQFFGNVKEGVTVAAAHPFITSGVALGLGSVALKRPRRFMYYSALRLFVSEKALISKADLKVKELQQSISHLKKEIENVEKASTSAENVLIRGRTKLRQAGKQIRSAVRSAYKLERQAAGLKDVLGELPRREVSRFKSEVSSHASVVKKERSALTKEVAKISNYGISI